MRLYTPFNMMDYNKTREDVAKRAEELTERFKRNAAEIARLQAEQAQIKRESIGLEQILDGLEFVASDVPPDFEPSGFTDKIRKILGETPIPLVPTQIRDALLAIGVTGSSSKNLLINVHTVLERIGDELQKSKTAEGKTAYKAKQKYEPWVSMAGILRGEAKVIGTLSDVSKMGALYGGMAPVPPKKK